jgi:TPR repeat protein
MYNNGYGIPQNYAEAMKWYRLSAGQGYAKAQYNLGVMYSEGYGVPQDNKEAFKWYRLAAEQGDASAHYKLGSMNESGTVRPKSRGSLRKSLPDALVTEFLSREDHWWSGIRKSLERCWNVEGLSDEDLKPSVLVGVELSPEGKVIEGSINLISHRDGNSESVAVAFENAKKAILQCWSKGVDLPKEHYSKWQKIEIMFHNSSF